MRGIRLIGIAARRALIARRNENRHALRHRLLINGIVRSIRRRSIHRFAFAITNTDHRRWRSALIQQILQRDQPAESGRIRTRRQFNCRAGSRRAGILRIQNRFAFVAVRSRIAAIICARRRRRMHLRKRSRSKSGKPERAAERSPIRRAEHVRIFNHHHRLPLPGNPRVKYRRQVVNRSQIGRHHRLLLRRNRIRRHAMHFVHRVRRKIMQRNHAHHRRSQRRGNRRIAVIRKVPHSVHFQRVNLRPKSFAHLPRMSRKIDTHTAGINHVDRKSMRFQPTGNRGHILRRQSKSLPIFLRANPVVIIRRPGRVQLVDKLVERHFLLRRAPQLQQHMLHRRIPSQSPAIVRRGSLRPRIPAKLHHLRVAHLLGNQRPRRIGNLRPRHARKAQDQHNRDSHKRGISQDESSVHGAPLSGRKFAVTRARQRPQRPKPNYAV